MPDKTFDQQIRQALNASELLTDDWLDSQRNDLMGAIDFYETTTHPIRKFFHSFQNYDYSWIPQMITAGAMVAVGIFIGTRIAPAPNSAASLEELFASGKIQTVELTPSDDAENQFQFSLVTQSKMEIKSSEADQKTAQLVFYKLTNTPNNGDRLKFAKQISQFNINNELTLTAIGRVLLDESNIAIQMALLESVIEKKNDVVRDVLVSLVMGEYPDAIRLPAIRGFKLYNDDEYIHQMLKIISATDQNPAIRYAAEQLIDELNFTDNGIAK